MWVLLFWDPMSPKIDKDRMNFEASSEASETRIASADRLRIGLPLSGPRTRAARDRDHLINRGGLYPSPRVSLRHT